MWKIFNLLNIKHFAAMAAFAATVSALVPSIEITIEIDKANACDISRPGCRP